MAGEGFTGVPALRLVQGYGDSFRAPPCAAPTAGYPCSMIANGAFHKMLHFKYFPLLLNFIFPFFSRRSFPVWLPAGFYVRGFICFLYNLYHKGNTKAAGVSFPLHTGGFLPLSFLFIYFFCGAFCMFQTFPLIRRPFLPGRCRSELYDPAVHRSPAGGHGLLKGLPDLLSCRLGLLPARPV